MTDRARVFLRLALVTGAVFLAIGVDASAALASCSTTCTWSGASSSNWSNTGNWASGNAPAAGSNGTINFPSTASGFTSQNDLSGASATGLTIDDASPYVIDGNALTLSGTSGSGGIDATTSLSSSAGNPLFSIPLTLSQSQSWSFDGGSSLGGAGMVIAGTVTGSASTALGITFVNSGFLNLTAAADVGPVTVTTDDAGDESLILGTTVGSSGGTPGTLNKTSGQPVSFTNTAGLQVFSHSFIGPLTMGSGSNLLVGSPHTSALLSVSGGVTLNSGASAAFAITGSGFTAGTDFSGLSAGANVDLGGSQLIVLDANCVAAAGSSYQLVATSTTLGGTKFGNAPSDGSVIPLSGCNQQAVRINYTTTTVTATILNKTGTTTSVSPSTSSPAVSDSVTYTATITPASGSTAPSGTVEFDDGGAPISGCGAQPLTATGSTATATCTTSYGAAGSHSITAVYSGDATYAGSTSAPVTVTVGGTTTTTTTTGTTTGTSTSNTAGGSTTISTTANSTTTTTTTTTTSAAGSGSGPTHRHHHKKHRHRHRRHKRHKHHHHKRR